jgi:hypothetical protein
VRDVALRHVGSSVENQLLEDLAPISSTSYFSRMPWLCRSIAALSAVWPPSVGRIASGFSLAMIVSMTCQVIGSM